MAACNYGNVSNSSLYPALILNSYLDENREEQGRAAGLHDGIWMANESGLADDNVTYHSGVMKRSIAADLNGDPDSYILAINWWQTFKPDMLAGKLNVLFEGDAPRPASITCRGAAVFRGTKVMAYRSGIRKWADVLALLPKSLADNLWPEPSIPFTCAFDTAGRASLPNVPFQLVITEDGKMHSGAALGALCAFEYTATDGSPAFGWSEGEWLASETVPALQMHDPRTMTNAIVAAGLAQPYWQRDVLMGHRDLILSLKPIEGGVAKASVTRLIFVVDLQGAPILVGGPVATANVYTMSVVEGADGRLHRIEAATFAEVAASVQKRVRLDANFADSARAQLQREVERQSSGKACALAHKEIVYTAPPVHWLALDASKHAQPSGDDRLTWTTGPDFTASQLAHSLVSRAWSWDAQREGKRGKAAAAFPQANYCVQDDARPKPKPIEMAFSYETHQVRVKVPIIQLSAAYKPIGKSAPLFDPPKTGPKRKWCALADSWIPKGSVDADPHALRAKYAHAPWAFWG